jgi:hypothetical protein
VRVDLAGQEEGDGANVPVCLALPVPAEAVFHLPGLLPGENPLERDVTSLCVHNIAKCY